MAKQKISEKLQKKFDKPQFQLGDAVFFSWLGQKKYGHVTKIKTSGWGVQYMVQSAEGTSYPCGIQIQGQKTHYNTGFIWFEDTVSIGQPELKKRIKTTKNTGRVTAIIGNPVRPKDESRNDNKNVRGDVSKSSSKNTATRAKGSTKSVPVSSSSNGDNGNNTTKRKNTKNAELDTAIAKQRSFLDFTKPVN